MYLIRVIPEDIDTGDTYGKATDNSLERSRGQQSPKKPEKMGRVCAGHHCDIKITLYMDVT
jgi:hypothetical protein